MAARNNPKYRFTVNLVFSGWHAVWVRFEEDVKIHDYKGSGELYSLFIYPKYGNVNSGELFIDHITLLQFVSNIMEQYFPLISPACEYQNS